MACKQKRPEEGREKDNAGGVEVRRMVYSQTAAMAVVAGDLVHLRAYVTHVHRLPQGAHHDHEDHDFHIHWRYY